MKRHWLIPACALWIAALLTGCARETGTELVQEGTTVVTETTVSTEPTLTEKDILDLFHGYAYADPADREAADCVVVTDFAYDLMGVVMYTSTDGEGSFFDFLSKDGIVIGQIELGALPAEDPALEYLGNGGLSCQLLNIDGSSYICKIFYTYDEENGTNFKIVGE